MIIFILGYFFWQLINPKFLSHFVFQVNVCIWIISKVFFYDVMQVFWAFSRLISTLFGHLISILMSSVSEIGILLVIMGGLTSGLLKYLALPVWWVGRIASLDFHSRAHLPLGCEGVELDAGWQVLPLTADNERDHLNRPFWSIHLVLGIINSRFSLFL